VRAKDGNTFSASSYNDCCALGLYIVYRLYLCCRSGGTVRTSSK